MLHLTLLNGSCEREGSQPENVSEIWIRLQLASFGAKRDDSGDFDNSHDVSLKLLTRKKQAGAFVVKASASKQYRGTSLGNTRWKRCYTCDVLLRAFFNGYLWQVPMSIFQRTHPHRCHLKLKYHFAILMLNGGPLLETYFRNSSPSIMDELAHIYNAQIAIEFSVSLSIAIEIHKNASESRNVH